MQHLNTMARQGSTIDLTSLLNPFDVPIQPNLFGDSNNTGNEIRRRKREADAVVDLTLDSEEEEQVMEVTPKRQKLVAGDSRIPELDETPEDREPQEEKRLAAFRKKASKVNFIFEDGS